MDQSIIPLIAVMSKDSPMLMLLLLLALQFINFNKITQYLQKQMSIKKRTRFTVKAHLVYRYNSLWGAEYSTNFLALCRYIRLSISKESNSNYEIKEYPHMTKDNVLFVHLKCKYKIAKEIDVYTEINTSQNDKNDHEYVTLSISLETAVDFCTLNNFISKCKKEYEDELLDNIKKQHVFIFECINKEDKNVVYKEHPFETTKSFDNMYFDEKEKLLEKLDGFLNNKSNYKRLGIPYTLGILLHGIPGTGKTSCLKSIAKYTGRHIVIIPTKNVKNIDTLKTIFMNEYINDIYIPNYKRLYVFEDIDCGCWKDVVISRDLRSELPAKEANVMLETLTKLKLRTKDGEDDDKPAIEINTLTLADFLELLDGIVEIPGRMIVMTSNRPEILDPALIRPGRIDVIIEFKKLSKTNIAQMYKQWFDEDLDCPELQDHVYTQADIGNLFSSMNKKEIRARLASGKN